MTNHNMTNSQNYKRRLSVVRSSSADDAILRGQLCTVLDSFSVIARWCLWDIATVFISLSMRPYLPAVFMGAVLVVKSRGSRQGANRSYRLADNISCFIETLLTDHLVKYFASITSNYIS